MEQPVQIAGRMPASLWAATLSRPEVRVAEPGSGCQGRLGMAHAPAAVVRDRTPVRTRSRVQRARIAQGSTPQYLDLHNVHSGSKSLIPDHEDQIVRANRKLEMWFEIVPCQ